MIEPPMSDADGLRESFVELTVNGDFSEAVVTLQDGGRLGFVHRVQERRTTATTGEAERIAATITRFRLNAKHLDVQFQDGSRWETAFHG